MRIGIGIAAALAAATAIAGAAQAADAIRPGRWEFTAQMQMPGGAAAPGPAAGIGGASATHTACVEPDKAVPVDPRPECRIEQMNRNGATVSWASACTTPRGTVRSEGVARYRGDTMDGALTTRLPQPDGRSIETHQRLIGRYLGACR